MTQTTVKMRTNTLNRIDEELAEYIGLTKKPISRSEYLDRLSKVKLFTYERALKRPLT